MDMGLPVSIIPNELQQEYFAFRSFLRAMEKLNSWFSFPNKFVLEALHEYQAEMVRKYPALADNALGCKLCSFHAVAICQTCFGVYCQEHLEHGEHEMHGFK
jgi:hypothetical protein